MSGCQMCGKPAQGPRSPRYCSDRCRAIAWRKRRASGQADREGRVRHLLVEALKVLQGQESADCPESDQAGRPQERRSPGGEG